VTVHQLLILFTVVNEGSFSNAARKLGISQAAVSAQIKALERELGQALLVRSAGAGKPELTPAGRLAYKAAGMVVRAIRNLTAQLQTAESDGAARSKMPERIAVAADPLAGLYLLPRLAAEFRRRQPGVEVRVLTDTDPGAVRGTVCRGGCDLGLVPAAWSTPGCVVEGSLSLALVAVANPRLADAGGMGDWSRLPLVLPSQGTALRPILDAYLGSLGLEPRLVAEVSHPEDARQTVKSRAAVTVTHAVAVEEDLALGTLVRVEPPAPLPACPYKVVRPRTRFRVPVREFARFLQERLEGETTKADLSEGRKKAPAAAEGGCEVRNRLLLR
jgi:molybdate transport repressor ModE-like protein